MLPAAVIVILLLPVLALAVMSLTSRRPSNLGVHDGKLAVCPESPNCVSTFASEVSQRMEPIDFHGTADDTLNRLRQVLAELPRAKIVTQRDDYLHVECSTALFHFVDDVEFLIDEDASVIHFHSASRAGHSDLGVNRRRMEQIAAAFREQ
ncbi:MAG: DUF1499 domain-containing protein [Planctomycetota bacterium]|jgi:uncharacterized protein (DUF1499 family)